MSDKFDLSNYVEVAERITMFREKHPDGSIQTRLLELPEAFAGSFVAVQAQAFRSPDDPCPGVDIAWEPVPGKTPYTRDSELMNASTSAIGRAIVAALAADTKRGMASRDEIRNRQADQEQADLPAPPAAGWPTLGHQRDAWDELKAATKAIEDDEARALVQKWAKEQGLVFGSFTASQADAWRYQVEQATAAWPDGVPDPEDNA